MHPKLAALFLLELSCSLVEIAAIDQNIIHVICQLPQPPLDDCLCEELRVRKSWAKFWHKGFYIVHETEGDTFIWSEEPNWPAHSNLN